MLGLRDKEQCSGCTACMNSCPHQAIRMQPDRLGFLYPRIDRTLCTCCGVCEKVCPFTGQASSEVGRPLPTAYAVRHQDLRQVAASQSGAAFIALSDSVMELGGVVYGAGYEGHFRVVHQRAVTVDERDRFRGSKYVQSDLGTVFRSVKTDLQAGKTVLFTGTPCQTAGLSAFLPVSLKKRLVLVDLVCHGVASPYLWRDYLRYLEHVHGAELVAVDFRDKRFGWHSHRESFRFKDGHSLYPGFTIYQDCNLRPSCGSCPFAGLKHPADITIGDFWGIEKTELRTKDDNKGFSLLLCHTDKGKTVFEQSRKHLEVYPMKPEACLQPNLQEPTHLPCSHRLIGKFYHRTGLCLFLTIRPVLCLIKRVIQRIKRAFL